MNPTPIYILILMSCYLIGSIPTAYIFGYLFKRIDIREAGSGNVGATNVYRVVGKLAGLLVLAIDIFKGYVCVTFIPAIFDLQPTAHHSQLLLFGLSAILGHNWPIFLKFKGGKGVAVSAGVLSGIMPDVLYYCLVVWLIVFILTRYVSLASIIASMTLPITILFLNMAIKEILFGVTLCLLSSYKHRANIRRLILGQEPRLFFVHHK